MDVIHFRMAILSQGREARELEEQQKARNDVLLILKREWEVTKYGPFTEFIIYLKNCVATKKSPRKIAFF